MNFEINRGFSPFCRLRGWMLLCALGLGAIPMARAQNYASSSYATSDALTTAAGIAVDRDGNVYASGWGSHTIVKITPSRNVTILAGAPGASGANDGPGVAARFFHPLGMAIDRAGNLFVADSGNHTIRQIAPDGMVTTVAGTVGVPGLTDGIGTAAQFNTPWDVAVDGGGNLYVTDLRNETVRKIMGGTRQVYTMAILPGPIGAGNPGDNDTGGLTVDAAGNVYVADTLNNMIQKVTPEGVVSVFAGAVTPGLVDGPGSVARFRAPSGITIDADGNLLVRNNGNPGYRRIDPAGNVTSLGGAAIGLYDLAVDAKGNLYAANTTNGVNWASRGAPRLLSSGTATGYVGRDFRYTAELSGVYTGITAAGLPNGLRMDSVTGIISGTPLGPEGTFPVALVATNGAGTSTSTLMLTLSTQPPPVPPVESRLAALSVRSIAGTGSNTLIAGVVVTGSGTKSLVMRGVGPTLAQSGVGNPLADPQLLLYNGGQTPIQTNDDWGGSPVLTTAFNVVGLAPLAAGSRDAGLLAGLSTGVYTAHVTSTAGTGVALMELYDYGTMADANRMSALSVRSAVGTGDQVLIVGLIIRGETAKTLLIRGLGPALASQGVGGTLSDPHLEVYAGTTVVAANDDWGGGAALATAFTGVGLAALPASSKDSALLVTLLPGVYTIQLSGVDGTTGVGLIEVYETP